MKIFAIIISAFMWSCFDARELEDSSLKSERLQGAYTYELDPMSQLVRFKQNNRVLSRKEFLELLSDPKPTSDDLRRLNNKLVASIYAENKGIKLKAPPISRKTYDKPFFWLVQPHNFANKDLQNTYKNYLVYCNPMLEEGDKNSDDYKQRFLGIVDKRGVHEKNSLNTETYKDAAVFFTNKFSAPDRLVIPCPFETDYKSEINKNLLNIGTYAQFLEKNISQTGNKERINAFWLAIGAAANKYLNDNPDKTIFLHTHGTGVYYLHFRIDVNIYDYLGVAQKLSSEPSASEYYESVFAGK